MTKRSLPRRRHAVGLGWRWGAAALLAAVAAAVAVALILDYLPRVVRTAPVAVGELAPVFVLESSAGEQVDLAGYLGRKAVLLVFYADYHCQQCRAQLEKLRRQLGRIRADGVEVLAISDDRVIEAKAIAAELGHEITILSDRSQWVGRRYGMRDAERRFILTGYVIIDDAGRVRARRLDPLFGEHGDEIVNILEVATKSTRR